MPRFDKTGPMGQGSMTGRGLGSCGGGRGDGRGYGRGFGRRFFTQGEEGKMLKDEAGDLEKELEAIKERLQELKSKK